MSDAEGLFEAIKRGDAAAVEALLAGAPGLASARNAAGVSAVLLAAYHGRGEIARAIRAHLPAVDVFEAAALGETDALVRHLDADPTLRDAVAADGFQPLGLASFFGKLEAAELLMERGADLDAPAENAMKVRPLHAAGATGDKTVALEISRRLLARGADPNVAQQGGFTPLHEAAMSGNEELVRLLLVHGASRDTRSEDGKTALELAREKGHEGIAALLV